ncbi:basic salivary proline-rich protein 1-like [Melospiza melodia melodia]|uniref:basic salivary proline-rich protein 1-like n=1 Tax=Melospiza melodia melodia TaxID=1914991 RepID=UPI002FD03B60
MERPELSAATQSCPRAAPGGIQSGSATSPCSPPSQPHPPRPKFADFGVSPQNCSPARRGWASAKQGREPRPGAKPRPGGHRGLDRPEPPKPQSPTPSSDPPNPTGDPPSAATAFFPVSLPHQPRLGGSEGRHEATPALRWL